MKHAYKIHRWLSLICAVFFLALCFTGLPLLFKAEISEWNRVNPLEPAIAMDDSAVWNGLAPGIKKVQETYPQEAIKSVAAREERSELWFRLPERQLVYNLRTQELTGISSGELKYPIIEDFMHLMDNLHVRLGLGKGGMLFLGVMCALSVVSIISGFWLYWPLLQRRQLLISKLSVWHRFTGIIAGVWALTLCLSGMMIVFFSLFYSLHTAAANQETQQAFAVYRDQPFRVSPSEALTAVNQTFNPARVTFFRLPDSHNHFYTFYLKQEPQKPDRIVGQLVFVAATGDKTVPVPIFAKQLPWYMPIRALFLNLHLHNHDLFMTKMIWAIYILVTEAMIISGMRLWWVHSQKETNVPKKHLLMSSNAKQQVWLLPSITGLTVAGLILPLYGGSYEAIGAAALFSPFVIFAVTHYYNRRFQVK